MSDDLTQLLMRLHRDNSPSKATREEFVRAPIGWPGAKGRSVKQLLQHLPYRNTWVDVFGGSGVVTCARHDSPLEVYNDRNSGLVALYRCLRDRDLVHQLRDRLELTPFAREEFMFCRDSWEQPHLDDIERAARFWTAHQLSFGKQGEHYGRVRSGKGDAFTRLRGVLGDFYGIHQRFRNVFVENMDWRVCLQDYDKSDAVIYLDPPYMDCTRNHYRFSMTPEEHAEMVDRVFHMKAFVAISGYDHDIYKRAPWSAEHSWEVFQSMSGSGQIGTEADDPQTRSNRREWLFIKEAS